MKKCCNYLDNHRAGAMPEEQARAILKDQAAILQNDVEAARYALTGRGYAQDFLDALWPHVFPNEPAPQVGSDVDLT